MNIPLSTFTHRGLAQKDAATPLSRKEHFAAWQRFDPRARDHLLRYLRHEYPQLTDPDRDDATQETMVAFYLAGAGLTLVSFKEEISREAAATAWLRKVSSNKARDIGRRKQTLKRGGGIRIESLDEMRAEASDQSRHDTIPDPASEPSLSPQAQERADIIAEILDLIELHCGWAARARIYRSRMIDGLSSDETASLHNTTVANVYTATWQINRRMLHIVLLRDDGQPLREAVQRILGH